jgi:hypothetical protein
VTAMEKGKLLERPVPPLPPDLVRYEVTPGAEREYWMSVLRKLLRPFRRKTT